MLTTLHAPHRAATLLAIGAAVAVFASSAAADSTPIGTLPPGPVATLTVERGELVSVALPAKSGRVWRLARAVNPKVLRQVSEGDLATGPVVVFRAVGKGRVVIRFALTTSDASSKALASRTLRVTVQ